nr:hypothetical protein [Lachnospiraceae bacterium]
LGLCVVILELLLVPLFATAFTAALIIILMSVIRVFRNKDVLRYIGIALLFLLLCVYFYISGRGRGSGIDMNSVVSQIESYESTLQYIVPVSGFLVDFYVNKSIVSLLIALVIVAAAVLLLYVVAKYLYLQGALNMQNTSIGGKILDEEELKKISQQKSPYKALVKKEMRSLRRNPVYTLNNFIIGVLWPIIAIIAFNGAGKIISSIIVMKEQNPDAMYVDLYAVIMEVALLLFLMMLIPCLYANIAYSSLTREGNSFPIMKQIPVAYDIQIKAKMAVAQRVLQFATVYVALFSLFLNWLMDVPIYYSIIPTLMSFLIINMFVCMDMIVGYKKASVGWDNEKKAVDKNSGLLIVLNLLLAFGIPLFCAIGLFLAEKDGDGQPLIMLIPTAIATIIIAIVGVILRKQAIKKGEKRIKTLRF